MLPFDMPGFHVSMADNGNAPGLRNLARGFLLAIAATVIGLVLTTQIPEAFADLLGKRLPSWFYAREARQADADCVIGCFQCSNDQSGPTECFVVQGFIKVFSVSVANYLATAYYR